LRLLDEALDLSYHSLLLFRQLALSDNAQAALSSRQTLIDG
jgi:hypothetical protein